jgi:hypothetical protein
MSSSHDSTPPRERRIEEAIADYLEAAEAGRAPGPEQWLARHPDLADQLRAFLADRASFLRAAGELAPPGPPPRSPANAAPLAPSEAPAGPSPLGTVRYFGDYELLEEIARGGMGVVYRARQITLNRPVALKMILAGQLASEADVRRFRTEAEAAANLDHPNIVPIYEVGEHHGQQYFSMKLIDGGGLDQRMAEFVRDPRSAARLMATVARAVHHAHQRGILHRDLKPGNVLLDAAGQPHVTDFGLAKRLADGPGATQSGAIVGTPAYMAPEQARAERLLTTAADVYALGAILYELLSGRPPFRAATPLDTVLQVLDQEPAPPAALNPKADAELAAVALKCLEKDPNRRYPSAAALAEELEGWLRGEGVQVRPVGRLRRRLRWTRQHFTINVLLLVGLGVPVGYIWVGWLWGALSATAAGTLTLLMALQMLTLLYALPARLSGWLASEERRAVPPAAPKPAPPPPPVPLLEVTAGQLRRSALTAAAFGAAEGLFVGGLLLAIHVMAVRTSLGEWPELAPDVLSLFLVQAAWMMALVRVLVGLFRVVPDLPADPRTGSRLRWLLGRLLGGPPYFGKGPATMLLAAVAFLPDTDIIAGIGRFDWILLLMFALTGGCGAIMLLLAVVALARGSTEWKMCLKMSVLLPGLAPFFCPAWGFLAAELLAGEAPPTAVGAPLYGTMIGWAIGNIFCALAPFGSDPAAAPAPETGPDQRPSTTATP